MRVKTGWQGGFHGYRSPVLRVLRPLCVCRMNFMQYDRADVSALLRAMRRVWRPSQYNFNIIIHFSRFVKRQLRDGQPDHAHDGRSRRKADREGRKNVAKLELTRFNGE